MHDDMTKSNINCWTNGFWPGLMWLMYSAEKKECYKAAAEWSEEQLDKALLNHVELSHDVGFIWRLASGFDYAITGSNEARNRQFRAADHLMSRFNPAGGGFIRAWHHGDYNPCLLYTSALFEFRALIWEGIILPVRYLSLIHIFCFS